MAALDRKIEDIDDLTCPRSYLSHRTQLVLYGVFLCKLKYGLVFDVAVLNQVEYPAIPGESNNREDLPVMIRDIKEPDWKVFRKIRVTALDRFCQRVLDELCRIAVDTSQSNHERYLAIYELLHKQDKELAKMFDNPRRSSGLLQLTRMWSMELLTGEELAFFTSDARNAVNAVLGVSKD